MTKLINKVIEEKEEEIRKFNPVRDENLKKETYLIKGKIENFTKLGKTYSIRLSILDDDHEKDFKYKASVETKDKKLIASLSVDEEIEVAAKQQYTFSMYHFKLKEKK